MYGVSGLTGRSRMGRVDGGTGGGESYAHHAIIPDVHMYTVMTQYNIVLCSI